MRVFVSVLVILAGVPIGQSVECATKGGFWALNLSPSARTNGMGEAAVATVDKTSFFYNPGSLGLMARRTRFSGTVYPGATSHLKGVAAADYDFTSAMFGLKPDELAPVSVGLAYYRTSYRTSFFRGGELDSHVTSDEISLGVGFDAGVEIGLGATLSFARKTERWYRWTDGSLQSEGETTTRVYDFGAVARKEIVFSGESSGGSTWSLTPSVGLSWSTAGPEYAEYPESGEPFDRLPSRLFRAGAAVELAQRNSLAAGWSVLAAYQYDNAPVLWWADHPVHRVGLEIGYAEFVYARGGLTVFDGQTEDYTIGGSIKLNGLLRNVLSVDLRRETRLWGVIDLSRLDVEFTTAYYPRLNYDTYMEESLFVQLSVTYYH